MSADQPTVPASHRDLIDARGVAALSTLGATGYPQTTAVWYLADGDVVRTSLSTERQKYRNLVRHPQATLFIIDPANPFRTLEVRADVTFEDDPEYAYLHHIFAAYGSDAATLGDPGQRVIATLTPTRVVANG